MLPILCVESSGIKELFFCWLNLKIIWFLWNGSIVFSNLLMQHTFENDFPWCSDDALAPTAHVPTTCIVVPHIALSLILIPWRISAPPVQPPPLISPWPSLTLLHKQQRVVYHLIPSCRFMLLQQVIMMSPPSTFSQKANVITNKRLITKAIPDELHHQHGAQPRVVSVMLRHCCPWFLRAKLAKRKKMLL